MSESVPSSRTRLLALLGDPVAHSLSPAFQNAALRAFNLDAVYVALRCGPNVMPGLLRGVALSGGGGNVTVPHKVLAAQAVDVATEAVRRTGACNTFWAEDGAVHGDNTDVHGFAAAARDLLGGDPRGARVLLLGAGGAAAAVLCALVDTGAAQAVVLNRTPSRAEELAQRFADRLPVHLPRAERALRERYDLVVNATSLGLRTDDPLPLDADDAARCAAAALDLVYHPDQTAWVRALSQRGVVARDGREMLLYQGAAAFRRWWPLDPPINAMRTALDQAVRDRR